MAVAQIKWKATLVHSRLAFLFSQSESEGKRRGVSCQQAKSCARTSSPELHPGCCFLHRDQITPTEGNRNVSSGSAECKSGRASFFKHPSQYSKMRVTVSHAAIQGSSLFLRTVLEQSDLDRRLDGCCWPRSKWSCETGRQSDAKPLRAQAFVGCSGMAAKLWDWVSSTRAESLIRPATAFCPGRRNSKKVPSRLLPIPVSNEDQNAFPEE